MGDGQRMTEGRFVDVSNPEPVKIMLDYMYHIDSSFWDDYNPRTQEITKDVMRLAQDWHLSGLQDLVTRWLAKDITTGNVVERLKICEEFGLTLLCEKILEQLTCNKKALAEVAHSPQIMQHPKLMQALLQQAASEPDASSPPARAGKK